MYVAFHTILHHGYWKQLHEQLSVIFRRCSAYSCICLYAYILTTVQMTKKICFNNLHHNTTNLCKKYRCFAPSDPYTVCSTLLTFSNCIPIKFPYFKAYNLQPFISFQCFHTRSVSSVLLCSKPTCEILLPLYIDLKFIIF